MGTIRTYFCCRLGRFFLITHRAETIMPQATASVFELISKRSGGNVRRNWAEAFRTVRAETERRASHLSAEDQGVQSMADASPTKWHRAHTTWFF
jgi:hypothetical protein